MPVPDISSNNLIYILSRSTYLLAVISDVTGRTSRRGPRLPAAFLWHCAANWNSSHVFVGSGTSPDPRAAWLVDTTTFIFHRLPNMPSAGRAGAACGPVMAGDKTAMAVAGGLTADNKISRFNFKKYASSKRQSLLLWEVQLHLLSFMPNHQIFLLQFL